MSANVTTPTPATTSDPVAPVRKPATKGSLVPPRLLPVLATFVLFVLMFGTGAARYENFGTAQTVANLLIDNSFLIVLAVGMTFVILTGGIDLSVGSVVALSTMVAAWGLQAGLPAPLIVLLVLATGTVFGLLQGLIIQRFDIQPFIVTLAGMFLARGLAFLISAESISIKDETFRGMSGGAVTLPGDIVITYGVVIALTVLAIAAYVLHRTRFGRTVYAVGGNEHSAMLMGLNTARVKVGVYTISGFCASLAGLLFSFYMLSGNALHAVGMELDAIAAVVIGGTLLAGGAGYVVGSLLGVLVLGTIQTLINFDGTLSSWWTKIFIGALLLAFIVLQRAALRRRQ
ncbi:galactofuranose ABC transporter, permease protein YjfF [Kineococcus xinjiangensis]|nr:galactofuranose ABC transporter, permease protein YjfF [Kineococcus xinjiangensis]